MRIVIDLQSCQNGSRARGIGRVALALTRAMIAAARGHEYVVLLSDRFPGTILPIRHALADLLPADRIVVCALPPRTASADPDNAWRTRAAEVVLARFIAELAPDLLFVLSLFEGFWDNMVTSVEPGPHRTAVLLYDFIPLDHPDIYLPGDGIRAAYYRKMRAAAAADLLVADSRHVASEAITRLDVPADRLVAMPLGVDPGFGPPPQGFDAGALMARYGIDRPFVLNTSPFEPRKNIHGLIAGFASMPAALRHAHRIVIVGRMDDAARRAIADLAAAAGLPAETVVLPGFVPDDDLIALYGSCALFAFPSLGEGFGLPVLEAMACGAPVIGSSTTSIPEVIGRDDLLCDPADPAAIGAAMARILGDATLRRELAAWGPARAATFTWETAAATALDAFERLCAMPPPPALPAPPPGPMRPSLALVCDSPRPGLVETLLRALDGAFAVTAVVPDGAIADPWTAANFEARDFRWLERHAPRFDHLLYVTAASSAGMLDLIVEHPGILLLLERAVEDPPRDALPQDALHDIFATGGFPALLAMRDEPAGLPCRGAALSRHAFETLHEHAGDFPETGWRSSADPVIGDRLRAAIRRASPLPDPRRTLAGMLPPAVRDTRPTSDDLANVAVAFARNEAYRRAPAMLVDVSALAGADRAVVTGLIAAGATDVRYVRMEGDTPVGADRFIAGLLGITTGTCAEPTFTIRPGDRLIRIDAPDDPDDALVAILEAGATLHRFTSSGGAKELPAEFAKFLATLRRSGSCDTGPDAANATTSNGKPVC